MDLNLAGRVAVVTGAGKGIGLATTRALAGEVQDDNHQEKDNAGDPKYLHPAWSCGRRSAVGLYVSLRHSWFSNYNS